MPLLLVDEFPRRSYTQNELLAIIAGLRVEMSLLNVEMNVKYKLKKIRQKQWFTCCFFFVVILQNLKITL